MTLGVIGKIGLWSWKSYDGFLGPGHADRRLETSWHPPGPKRKLNWRSHRLVQSFTQKYRKKVVVLPCVIGCVCVVCVRARARACV